MQSGSFRSPSECISQSSFLYLYARKVHLKLILTRLFLKKSRSARSNAKGYARPSPIPARVWQLVQLGYLACFARVLADTFYKNDKKLQSFTFLEHFLGDRKVNFKAAQKILDENVTYHEPSQPPPPDFCRFVGHTLYIKGELCKFSTTFQTKLYHENSVKSIFFASCI